MKKRKQRRGIKTKNKILEVALQLFSEQGYDYVTVDDITKKSNTSKGSFYAHFRSKDEIFIEKFKEIDEFYSKFKLNIPQNLKPIDKIYKFINAQMNYIQNELGKEIMQVIYGNSLTLNPHKHITDTNRPMFTILSDFIKEAQEQGDLRDDLLPNDVLETLGRCIRGSIYDWCISIEDYDLAEDSIVFFERIIEGLEK